MWFVVLRCVVLRCVAAGARARTVLWPRARATPHTTPHHKVRHKNINIHMKININININANIHVSTNINTLASMWNVGLCGVLCCAVLCKGMGTSA